MHGHSYHRSAGRHPLAATDFGARLGAFFYSTGCFENKGTVREYRSDLSDQPALEIRVSI